MARRRGRPEMVAGPGAGGCVSIAAVSTRGEMDAVGFRFPWIRVT